MFRNVNFPSWGKSTSTPSSSTAAQAAARAAREEPSPPASSSRSAAPASSDPTAAASPSNARRPGSKDQPLGRSFLGPPKSSNANARPQIGGKGVSGHMGGKVGVGGKGLGLGKGKGGLKRHRKIMKDTVKGITKGDIRRLARRGGVKRLSAPIYEDVREAVKDRLALILKDCICYVDHRNAKTITVSDVIFALQRIGRPIYGFGERANMFR